MGGWRCYAMTKDGDVSNIGTIIISTICGDDKGIPFWESSPEDGSLLLRCCTPMDLAGNVGKCVCRLPKQQTFLSVADMLEMSWTRW